MTIQKRILQPWLLMIVSVLFMSCASDAEKNIEEAKFMLDRADYSGAEVKARAALAEEPNNSEAKFVLGTALLGKSFLGNGRSYLGLISDLQREKGTGESDFETFVRIAPVLGVDTLVELEEARDTLLAIPLRDRTHDVWLQIFVSRLFEIATVTSRIGAKSEDLLCNSNHADPNKDGVPDAFDASALSGDNAGRFQDNVDNINSDGQNAGLPSSFSLNDRLTSVGTGLATEVTAAGGDSQLGAQNYLSKQFCDGSTDCSTVPCIIPK